MPGYDQSLDVSLFKEIVDLENTRITVGVWCYNGGRNKIQIGRENLVDDQWNFTKLGRMSKQEIEGCLPIIIRAVEVM